MEKRINELEFDEFEKLLGEIPSATSGNLSSDQSGVTNFSKDLKVSSLYGSLSLERQRVVNNGALNEGKVSPSNVQQSNIKGVQLEEPNLPDDQSLTSAFTELSFKDRGVTGPANPPLVNGTSFLLNGQCPNSLKNLTSRMDFSGAVPLAHGVQGFHLLQNVPIPGVEFPVIPNQQQFYMDAPAGLPYLHPQQLSQPQITWRHVEEEQYYRMHQQYMYLQQLRNQQVESQHPIQNNGNLVRIMNRGAEHLYNQKQVSFQREQFNQQPFRNKTTIPRSTNRIVDQTDKRNFPEKILTRANGLNSLRSIKFGSFGGNEPLVDVKYGNRNLSTPNVGLRMDSLSSRGSSLGIFDLKHNTPLQKCNSLEEFTGRIYLMAKDQHGCRFLQRKFTEGTPEDVEKIFLEIIVHIVELMTDPFGNYLVQKLLEVCDEDQQMQILHSITRKTGDLVRISCDMHGTRAVQKVIETLKTPEQFSLIVSALKPGIVTMVKNMNGNHVAQRCLQYLTSEYSEFLFEAATANCVELATDRHGCCVLQKCLSHSDNEQRCALVHEITSNALILSQDPFGNYVVQFVLEIHVPWATAEILDQLEGNYVDLSVQKYSSNVVEKCLKYAGEERRLSIIQELVNNPRLDQIMQDPYGNYVIQAALNLSKGALHAALMEAIRAHVPVLRSSPYGKKILSSNGLKK